MKFLNESLLMWGAVLEIKAEYGIGKIFCRLHGTILMAGNEEVFCRSFESRSSIGDGIKLYPLDSDSFDDVQKMSIEQMMCSGKARAYHRENASHYDSSAVDILPIYMDNTMGTTGRTVFVKFLYVLWC